MFPTTLSDRLRVTVTALLAHLARYGLQRRVPGPLLSLIHNHIRALEHRACGVLARLAAGTLRRHPGRRAAHPHARRSPRSNPLPHGAAWLLRLVPETAWGGSGLTPLLQDPALPALLAAAPQLGRALRPLCRMLGLQLPPPATPPLTPPPPAPLSPAPPSPAPPQAHAQPRPARRHHPATPRPRPRHAVAPPHPAPAAKPA